MTTSILFALASCALLMATVIKGLSSRNKKTQQICCTASAALGGIIWILTATGIWGWLF